MRRVSWSRIGLIGAVLIVCLAAGYLVFRASPSATGQATGELYATIGPEQVTLPEIERAHENRAASHENLTRRAYFEEVYSPQQLLILEARDRGIEVSDEEIDTWISTINDTLRSRNVSFETYLSDLNATRAELRSDIRTSMLVDRVLEAAVASQVSVSAEEVEAAYEAQGYESLEIPLEQARDEIGPRLLREKQDARLRELIEELNDRYGIRLV